MPGLRATTLLFVVLTLLPAGILAWLGLRASAPLVEQLRQQARIEAGRAVQQAAEEVQGAAAAHHGILERDLEAAAARLREMLPAGGAGVLRELEAGFARGALRLAAADGRALLPRGPAQPPATWLPEWASYCELRQRCDRGERSAAVLADALLLEAAPLRALAIAQACDLEQAAELLQREGWPMLAAAGPLPCEVMARTARGRERLAAAWRSGGLYQVPATEAGRTGWLVAAGVGDEDLARSRLRARSEAGEPMLRLLAPVAAGAVLELLLDPAETITALVSQGDRDGCALSASPATAVLPLAFPAPATASIAVATACGTIAITAEHRGLPAYEAGARRQHWLTVAGIALLLAVLVAGVALARRALVQQTRARALRDDFLAAVSHELKTPLTSLCLHAEMLAQDGLAGAERERYGQVALAEGARLSAMVEDLLDFAALARGVRRIEPEPVDLARAARQLAEAWRPICAREGIALRCETAADATAMADPTALSRIIANLLQNAVRHGRPPRNGAAPAISMCAGPGPCLEVRDNGPGVPAQLRERVFQRFERGSRNGKGLGLGLALSRELAESCGGSLTLADDGRETTFRLELPPVPMEAEA